MSVQRAPIRPLKEVVDERRELLTLYGEFHP